MKKLPRSVLFWVYLGSLALHGAFAVGAVLLPKPKRTTTVAIELAEAKKKKEPPKPPPPPPPPPAPEKPKPRPPPPQQAQAKVAPEAKTEAPPPTPGENEGFVDTGISLGNADGPGIAVPTAVAAAATRPVLASAATARHRVEQLAPAPATECSDPVVKPRRKSLVTPKYTLEARQADIEGIIRVEVTIDETGRVASARVLSGLGYGLDETALAAAKMCTFEPATQCGKPIVGTAVLPFRMELE